MVDVGYLQHQVNILFIATFVLGAIAIAALALVVKAAVKLKRTSESLSNKMTLLEEKINLTKGK